MSALIALAGLGIGACVTLGFLAVACLKPVAVLGQVADQVVQLRREVVDHRAANEHLAAYIVRRLDAVEQTTAQAANEVRMASDQLMAAPAPDTGIQARESS